MAFDWLMTAFAGHLETRQLLLLWDRIIGYNTLSLLPGEWCLAYNYVTIIAKQVIQVTVIMRW